jgi:hypothetical protein
LTPLPNGFVPTQVVPDAEEALRAWLQSHPVIGPLFQGQAPGLFNISTKFPEASAPLPFLTYFLMAGSRSNNYAGFVEAHVQFSSWAGQQTGAKARPDWGTALRNANTLVAALLDIWGEATYDDTGAYIARLCDATILTGPARFPDPSKLARYDVDAVIYVAAPDNALTT